MSRARRALPEASRRGWCPSLARPMPTGDGLLARVHPPESRLTAIQLRALADAARRYGNGHIDITGRANLQLRGITEATRRALACDLASAGLADTRDDGGPQRLTLASPLAGLDPTDLDGLPMLLRAIECVGRGLSGLPPKSLVTIDGGGHCGPGNAEADILLVASKPGHLALGLAGREAPLWCGTFPLTQVPAMVGLALGAFAKTGRRRMRNLDDTERAMIGAMCGWREGCARNPAPRPSVMPGLMALDENRVAIAVEAPFGRCTANHFDEVASLAGGVGLTASRGLVLVAEPERAAEIRDALAGNGFVTSSDDPRRAVSACPGAPACHAGSTPIPAHAEDLARAFAPFSAHGLRAHVSGCAKGCAHPASADLTLVAERGRYGVVLDGSPGDAPSELMTFEAVLERVSRADPRYPLQQVF